MLVEQIVGVDNKLVADDGPDSLKMGHRGVRKRTGVGAGYIAVGVPRGPFYRAAVYPERSVGL